MRNLTDLNLFKSGEDIDLEFLLAFDEEGATIFTSNHGMGPPEQIGGEIWCSQSVQMLINTYSHEDISGGITLDNGIYEITSSDLLNNNSRIYLVNAENPVDALNSIYHHDTDRKDEINSPRYSIDMVTPKTTYTPRAILNISKKCCQR